MNDGPSFWDRFSVIAAYGVKLALLDSDWEAEFCRVSEAHPKVLAYTKNHCPNHAGGENVAADGGGRVWHRTRIHRVKPGATPTATRRVLSLMVAMP
jgi:hypothetical protein